MLHLVRVSDASPNQRRPHDRSRASIRSLWMEARRTASPRMSSCRNSAGGGFTQEAFEFRAPKYPRSAAATSSSCSEATIQAKPPYARRGDPQEACGQRSSEQVWPPVAGRSGAFHRVSWSRATIATSPETNHGPVPPPSRSCASDWRLRWRAGRAIALLQEFGGIRNPNIPAKINPGRYSRTTSPPAWSQASGPPPRWWQCAPAPATGVRGDAHLGPRRGGSTGIRPATPD